MNLPFAELDRAARTALRPPIELREDCYQAAWVRFLEYHPATIGGAFLMAKHAGLDLIRRERKHRHIELLDVYFQPVPVEDDQMSVLWTRFPEETCWLLTYYDTLQHTGAERIKAYRMRERMKRYI